MGEDDHERSPHRSERLMNVYVGINAESAAEYDNHMEKARYMAMFMSANEQTLIVRMMFAHSLMQPAVGLKPELNMVYAIRGVEVGSLLFSSVGAVVSASRRFPQWPLQQHDRVNIPIRWQFTGDDNHFSWFRVEDFQLFAACRRE